MFITVNNISGLINEIGGQRLNVPNFAELLTGDFTAEVFLDNKVILEYVLRGGELS